MNSTQLTKIAAAIVITLLTFIAIGKFTNALYSPKTPEIPGFEVAVAAEGAEEVAKPVVVAIDIAALMANADVAKGKTGVRSCAACHTFELGGKDKSGPNLFNILGKAVGSKEGYKYSKALQALNAEGKVWGYAEMFAFLKKPKDYAKGTSMGFGGIKKATKQADVVAYLRSLSENPIALPE